MTHARPRVRIHAILYSPSHSSSGTDLGTNVVHLHVGRFVTDFIAEYLMQWYRSQPEPLRKKEGRDLPVDLT